MRYNWLDFFYNVKSNSNNNNDEKNKFLSAGNAFHDELSAVL